MYVDLLNSGPEANLADEINIIDFRDSFRPIRLIDSPKDTFTRLQKLHAIQRVYFLVSEETLDGSLRSYANIASTTIDRCVNVKIAYLNNSKPIRYRTYSPVGNGNKEIDWLSTEIKLRAFILNIDYTENSLSFDVLEKNIKSALKIHDPEKLKINWYNSQWEPITSTGVATKAPTNHIPTFDERSALVPQPSSPARLSKNPGRYVHLTSIHPSTNTDPKEHGNPKNSAAPPLRFSVNADPYSSPTNTCCSTWCACWPWSSSKTIYG